MRPTDFPEERFVSWFAAHESDCAEFRDEIENLYDIFLRRVHMKEDSPMEPLLRDYVFGDYEPL